jgi:DNA-binding transcriptional ArsR family regulator
MDRDDRAVTEAIGDEQFQALVEAMEHPVQSQLLFVIGDKPGVTIREISTRLSEPERRVRHHLGALLKKDLVKVESETQTRNTVEKRYRANYLLTIHSDKADELRVIQHRRISLAILKLILADAQGAVRDGTFGSRDGRAVVRFWAEVDRRGWEDLVAVNLKAWSDTEAALERCADRLRDGSSASFPVTSVFLLHEAPGWEG